MGKGRERSRDATGGWRRERTEECYGGEDLEARTPEEEGGWGAQGEGEGQ